MKVKENYVNVIPMKEIRSTDDLLFPFPIYNELRSQGDIRYDETRKCWDLFRYADIQSVLKQPKVFSSQRGRSTSKTSILTMDPPKHTKMRALVNKAFTPKAIKQIEEKIKDLTHDLLHQVKDQRTFDIVQDLAAPLPVMIIAELLGAEVKDRELIKKHSDALVAGAKDDSKEAVQAVVDMQKQAEKELSEYFAHLIQKRKETPADDLISLLIQAEIDGERLSENELLGFCILLLVAGNETTTNLITNAVRLLTEQPHIAESVRQDLSLIPQLTEETLRYYPPVQAIGRVAAEDVQIAGSHIEKGDYLISWVASANRDERKFEDPDTFRLDRKSNPHLSFGFGIHFCLGAPLARLEAHLALEILLRTFREITCAADQLKPIQSTFVFGVKEFPVQVTRF
ncbi:cytochrome P450 [Bacillus altitudinis]|uniref:cytochrome P450 n=1 Tax=Bacillus altitudinis TaxID=293387 RepID=UPI0011B35CAF|nr:cytochrome P450 [Bacillus altitudinis]QDZ96124.1 cytochrome P450 [Bacillus altitudinis]